MKESSSDECFLKREKNTNRNLARATTKSKSKMQTVSNGHVSRKAMN